MYWLRLLSHEEEEEFAKNVQAYIDGIDSYSGDLDERAMNLRSYITPNHRTSIFEAIPFLSTLRLEDFQRYCSDFFKQIHVEIFAHGNIDKKEAIDTVQRLLNGMEWKWNQIDDVSFNCWNGADQSNYSTDSTYFPTKILKKCFHFVYFLSAIIDWCEDATFTDRLTLSTLQSTKAQMLQ